MHMLWQILLRFIERVVTSRGKTIHKMALLLLVRLHKETVQGVVALLLLMLILLGDWWLIPKRVS